MSDPDFTRSCYATDADLYKAKAEYYEAKVEELEYKLKGAIAVAEREVILRKERQNRVEELKEKAYWESEYRDELKAKVDGFTAALKLASLHFTRSTKYGRGWQDALAYIKQAVQKKEGE